MDLKKQIAQFRLEQLSCLGYTPEFSVDIIGGVHGFIMRRPSNLGVLLRGPEGAQRPRALSAATAKLDSPAAVTIRAPKHPERLRESRILADGSAELQRRRQCPD